MKLSSEEQAVIEKALKSAYGLTTDQEELKLHQELLEKLQAGENSQTPANEDGFRYDYDDSSDV
ncbi:hypothetical protein FZC78_11715 [Rossellomorea vietnamensis]|uniref:Uncharacterized protein n=1 Tax=Rossellomorea vietnamensis TaxID=218284 RepID=A0A5D4NRY3_9BACI|nr:hypothetical protein [Rossellomorea vietnamensis]TYS16650.1 hypothetical protein FZC78_11715 [Rossellomorea vietnamensis]